jgi:hypothetical protein
MPTKNVNKLTDAVSSADTPYTIAYSKNEVYN